ncbi:hypothetical protein NJC40_15765 [Pseudomonas sp. 21LCFQ02]|uniref:hypothetical protein n=1 Tax=unclassified Pseudomonas TaxID=196821 RepID=UPI0004F7F2D2|nr:MULTISPECIES: hypothetical protein [unclassified Pseudomonas]MCO8169229.1 hypothetical protein [Pseudomonas sp. 21LCFQ02]MCQ9424113.1 hypothetical protein [Pseudomonas sp. LJDD11]BAP40968.1 glutathione S-transferase, N-terminal domain-containing protein 1 [Pseudomonas sp. StFLB209]
MAHLIRISDVPRARWIALRDQLAADGWTLIRGGGLDHSWATLHRGEPVIEMQWDNWTEGEITYAQEQAGLIEAQLPEDIRALPKAP